MHPLQMMLDEAGIKTRSYSGRGMYGKYCLSVNVDDLGKFIADVVSGMQSQVGGENIDEITKAFRRMSTDSMGRGMVVYFPNVPFEGDESDSEDEDSEDDG